MFIINLMTGNQTFTFITFLYLSHLLDMELEDEEYHIFNEVNYILRCY